MKKISVLVALFLGWAAMTLADDSVPPKVHPDSTGWQKLFADDLSDANFPEGIWFHEDGLLTASEDQVIWTKKEYGNAMIDFEFRTGPNANSGLFVYGNGDLGQWGNSLEVQILDDYGDKWQTVDKSWQCGSLFGRLAAAKHTVKHAGEWNRMTVTCLGKKIYVLLNGEQVNEIDMTKWTSPTKNPDGTNVPEWILTPDRPVADMPTSGHIGLQGKHGGAPIYFRNLKIKAINP